MGYELSDKLGWPVLTLVLAIGDSSAPVAQPFALPLGSPAYFQDESLEVGALGVQETRGELSHSRAG